MKNIIICFEYLLNLFLNYVYNISKKVKNLFYNFILIIVKKIRILKNKIFNNKIEGTRTLTTSIMSELH